MAIERDMEDTYVGMTPGTFGRLVSKEIHDLELRIKEAEAVRLELENQRLEIEMDRERLYLQDVKRRSQVPPMTSGETEEQDAESYSGEVPSASPINTYGTSPMTARPEWAVRAQRVRELISALGQHVDAGVLNQGLFEPRLLREASAWAQELSEHFLEAAYKLPRGRKNLEGELEVKES